MGPWLVNYALGLSDDMLLRLHVAPSTGGGCQPSEQAWLPTLGTSRFG